MGQPGTPDSRLPGEHALHGGQQPADQHAAARTRHLRGGAVPGQGAAHAGVRVLCGVAFH